MSYRFLRHALTAALTLLPLAAHAGLADRLKNLADGLATLGGGLTTTLGTLGGGLTTTLGTLGGGLQTTLEHLRHEYLNPTPGTTSFETYLEFQGVARKIVVIRPEVVSATPAPAVILLHYSQGTPEVMANLAQAGRLAAEHGAWVILPEAANGEWQADPSSWNGTDDVGFLAMLIATMTANEPLDAKRIYLAGMSRGGFMAERFACERPELIAGAAAVAATLSKAQSAACAPARGVPTVLMLGSKDPRYALYFSLDLGLLSGEDSFARLAALNGCDPAQVVRSALPDVADDGTTTTLVEAASCTNGGPVQYYDIEGGGHTWPQGAYAVPSLLGRVAQDFNATDAIWDFFSALPPAP